LVDPADPRQAYGEAKRASELLGLASQADGGPSFVSARGFAFHGPGLPLNQGYAIGNFLQDALGRGPIQIQGDGTPRRSYLYAADLAVWLWALLTRGCPGSAYNVGSPDDLSILSLAEAVRDAAAPGREIILARTPIQGQSPLRYVPDTNKAEMELGLHPIIGLDEGIRRTARWHRENSWV
jgi:dTDP-glucose 4,6-dehydratase